MWSLAERNRTNIPHEGFMNQAINLIKIVI